MSWWKKLVIAALGLFAIAILLLVIEHYRGKMGLRRWLTRMEAKGEVFRVEALAPPPVLAEKNGMAALTWAAAQLSGLPSDHQPPIGRYVAPGKMLVIWQLEQWSAGSRSASNITWEAVAEHLTARQQAFEDVREALDSEHVQATLDYHRGFSLPLPHLARMKGMAQTLAAAVVYELHRGNREEALRNLELLLRVPARWNSEPLLISHLVRIAIARIGMGTTWQALQAKGWSDEQLLRMQTAWSEIDFLPGMESAIAMERAMTRIEMESFRDSSRGLSEIMDGNGGGPPPSGTGFTFSFDWFMDALGQTPEFFNTSVVSPIWKFAWSYQDELYYLQNMQQTLEASRAAREKRSLPRKPEDTLEEDDGSILPSHSSWDRRNFYDRLRFAFSAMLEEINAGSIRRAWIAQTLKELTVTAIALRRYELRNGQVAASLETLVPEFVTETPRDYMDGKPLRFRASSGGFVLYSVGVDRIDHGGEVAPKTPSSTNFNPENSRDLVWPQPATPHEVEAYQKRDRGARK